MPNEQTRPPRDNLVRALADGLTLSEDGKTLFGRISPADEWTEVRSSIEGHFMERFAPGALKKTFAERSPKILFNHGKDATLGHQIIAQTVEVGEDAQGGYYRGEILDGLPPLILDGLKRGLYGSSQTFGIVRENWVERPTKSPTNPNGLPERTVIEARVPELGPVTWPQYAGAVAGVRSLTDEYTLDRLAADPDHLREIVGYVSDPAPSDDAGEQPHLDPERRDDPPPEASTVITKDPPEGGSPDSRKETVSDYITRDEKAARVVELESAISARAVEYPGVFPADVQATDDSDNAERDELVADIAAWDSRQARLRAFAGDPKQQEATYSTPVIKRTQSIEDIHDLNKIRSETRTRDEYDTKVRENALRSIDSQRNVKDLNHLVDLVENNDEGEEGTGELAQRILTTGSPVYKRAFAKYLKHGNMYMLSPEEQRAAIAVVGTTTTGGYAVPYVFDPTMYHTGVWTAENPFRQACRTVEITNGNNWRTVTVGAITSAYATESLANSENAPSFGQPTYTVQRAQAFATLSIETLEDRSDITAELTSVFAESKDTLEENKFAVGSNVGPIPFGMFTDAAYTNQDTATNDVTALADLLVLEGALPLRYRKNAAFFMNRSTLRQLMALDTTYRYFSGAGIQFAGNNQPNTNGSNGGGNSGIQCLGYPVWEVPSAVSTLTTDSAIIVVFADPKSYVIVDRIGMNVEVVPVLLDGATPSFPTGQRGIYVHWRNTAKPIAADAGRSLSVQ